MTLKIFHSRTLVWTAAVVCVCASPAARAKVDISGTYDVGTLTPLERPQAYGDNLTLTPERAQALAAQAANRLSQAGARSNPDRSAPEKGARVGGYNAFWIDRGDSAVSVDGTFRTSIITRPKNGRIPPMTDYGAQRRNAFLENWQIIWRSPDPTQAMNTGTAWWLEKPANGAADEKGTGIGPYDNLEQRPLAERCIIGSRSTAGPPMLPNLYNNHKRIIQTDEHIMILTEMNHDARVIRLNSVHRPNNLKTWLGDSIGYWQDGTLIVETRNFKETPPLSGADEHLHVEERFTRNPDGSLHYAFTVNNPEIWTSSWGGEYTWKAASGDKVYEYACHEGNYALGNIMRGARLLEKDFYSAD